MRIREKTYKNRISRYRSLFKKVQKFFNIISYLRAISAILFAAIYFSAFYLSPSLFYYALSFVFLLVFLAGINIHKRLSGTIKKLNALLLVNREALQRVQDKWPEFSFTGDRFLDGTMPQLTDLNILGRNSLFQMIQLTSTLNGAKKLAHLLGFCNDFFLIPKRQESIKEISSLLSMRQHLLMEGRLLGKPINPERFLEWIKSPSFLTQNKWLVGLQRILVPITFVFLILDLLFVIPPFWEGGFVLQLLVFTFTVKKCRKHYIPALNRDSLFLTYSALFRVLERGRFKAEYLKGLQSKLMIKDKSISFQMKKLERINNCLSVCYGFIYPFVNILFLWDIHFLYKLEKWKEDTRPSIETCFDVLGEMEALSSLGGFCYDNPEYTFPSISHREVPLEGNSMGHPLIPVNERINNDFLLPSEGSLGLITGSNMSGKSTFIRTIGINMALAFSGAPVAARKFVARPCKVMTCINVHDSLHNHISHFYAEVKRIKKIIDAVHLQDSKKQSFPVLYLVDEIFSGTNSKERIIASRGIMTRIAKSQSYGLLTTHDLDLTVLEKESDNIKNFHFQDSIDQNGKMYFNYQIHTGPVSSTNALKILKLEGIDFL